MMFAALPHISVKADEVFSIAGLPITNANLVGILGLVLLVWLMFRTRAAVLGRKKSNFATRLTLWCIEGLYKTVGQVIPNQKWARRVAPLVMTMFFFIAGHCWADNCRPYAAVPRSGCRFEYDVCAGDGNYRDGAGVCCARAGFCW